MWGMGVELVGRIGWVMLGMGWRVGGEERRGNVGNGMESRLGGEEG